MSPTEVVQRQLEAYNAKDVDALLATYAPAAEQQALHGAPLASGHEALRQRFTTRFAEPDLHATLLGRIAMGRFVVDHEIIRRNFAEGRGTVEMLCIYEVTDGLIRKASFAVGPQAMENA